MHLGQLFLFGAAGGHISARPCCCSSAILPSSWRQIVAFYVDYFLLETTAYI